MESKSTHERRQHALGIAMSVTAIIFVGWVATLGVRASLHDSQVAKDNNGSQTAAVGMYGQTTNTLEVVK